LFDLPGFAPGDVQSLAQRNLLRHLTFGLPSGQSVAKAMKQPVLDADHLEDLEPLKLHNRTPLWFYILREAEVREDGEQLAPSAAASLPRCSSACCKATRCRT
jgi:hypothetical protein